MKFILYSVLVTSTELPGNWSRFFPGFCPEKNTSYRSSDGTRFEFKDSFEESFPHIWDLFSLHTQKSCSKYTHFIEDFIRSTTLILGRVSICLQNSLYSLCHGFHKMLETSMLTDWVTRFRTDLPFSHIPKHVQIRWLRKPQKNILSCSWNQFEVSFP